MNEDFPICKKSTHVKKDTKNMVAFTGNPVIAVLLACQMRKDQTWIWINTFTYYSCDELFGNYSRGMHDTLTSKSQGVQINV